MTKTDTILGHIIDIKSEVSGINQHLKTLNGSVLRHNKEIEENTIHRIKVTDRVKVKEKRTKLLFGSGIVLTIFIIVVSICALAI